MIRNKRRDEFTKARELLHVTMLNADTFEGLCSSVDLAEGSTVTVSFWYYTYSAQTQTKTSITMVADISGILDDSGVELALVSAYSSGIARIKRSFNNIN